MGFPSAQFNHGLLVCQEGQNLHVRKHATTSTSLGAPSNCQHLTIPFNDVKKNQKNKAADFGPPLY
jgi:hypothetical protein